MNNNYLKEKLLKHRGHNVVIASYGDSNNPQNVCLECEDCNEIILDTDYTDLIHFNQFEKKEGKVLYDFDTDNGDTFEVTKEDYDGYQGVDTEFIKKDNKTDYNPRVLFEKTEEELRVLIWNGTTEDYNHKIII